jgi:hypothetical protein
MKTNLFIGQNVNTPFFYDYNIKFLFFLFYKSLEVVIFPSCSVVFDFPNFQF